MLHMLQNVLGSGMRRSRYQLREVRTRNRTREVCYTVCKPVYETKTKDICYTVCKPVLRNQDHGDLLHGLQAGATRRKTREICYTVCKPVLRDEDHGEDLLHGLQAGLGNQDREICYTVCKPCYETKTREICYTVCKPVYEDQDPPCYTVCKPCWETKTARSATRSEAGALHQDDPGSCGHWETEEYCVPGPTHTRCVREPGTWTYDPCLLLPLCPGKCHTECVQCPPRKCCSKHWVRSAARKRSAARSGLRTRTQDLLLQGLPHGS